VNNEGFVLRNYIGVTGMPQPKHKSDERYTYADYLTWPDDERWEIIDGVAYAMCPAPGRKHQLISRNLERQIDGYLKDKSCDMYHAPFDVRLSERTGFTDEKIETVVQPDLLIVCDKSKLDERGCIGAPDIVVEILSPSTATNDIKIKFDLYQRHGVKEYWIVHPEEQTVMVFKRGEDETFGKPERYAKDDKIPVPLLGDLVIDLAEVFAE
jgi:Uma2 family endonuclease